MDVVLRPAVPEDSDSCGQVSSAAFAAIADLHRFPRDVASPQEAAGQFRDWIAARGRWVLVAEQDGVVVGSIVLDERGPIIGLGPVTVDPAAQDRRIGRQLMTAALDRAAQAPGIRLVQAAYHRRTLALYARLGFDVREPLACLSGRLAPVDLPDRVVRTATPADIDPADRLCRAVHGHDRHGEMRDAVLQATATVVECSGELTGYATQIGFGGHCVARTDDDILALIAAAPTITGQGFLLPTRNTELLRRCLELGMRIEQPLTLMTTGFYQEPKGSYLPSISY